MKCEWCSINVGDEDGWSTESGGVAHASRVKCCANLRAQLSEARGEIESLNAEIKFMRAEAAEAERKLKQAHNLLRASEPKIDLAIEAHERAAKLETELEAAWEDKRKRISELNSIITAARDLADAVERYRADHTDISYIAALGKFRGVCKENSREKD